MSTQKENRIEEILSSLDGVKRAPAPDFFYTRLKARMEKGFEPAVARKRVLYPAYALIAVVAVVLLNAVIMFSKNTSSSTDTALNETENLQSIAAEYNISDVSSLYDLNEER